MGVDSIFGLPAHPIFVHAAVALVPLAALAGVVVAVRPGWRAALGWAAVAVAGFAVITSYLTQESGEALQDSLKDIALESETVKAHAELGESLVWFAVALFAAILVLVLWDRRRRLRDGAGAGGGSSRAALVLAGLVVIVSIVAPYG